MNGKNIFSILCTLFLFSTALPVLALPLPPGENQYLPWGTYGPCNPNAIEIRTKGVHVVAAGKSLNNVPTNGIDVLDCHIFDGPGGTFVMPCPSGSNYSYCLRNQNDGVGNDVYLGVREIPGYNNLIGLWHLDGNASDASGSGHNGIISGATPISDGISGGAYTFNGSAGIDVGNLDFSGGSYTVNIWVRTARPGVINDGRMAINKADIPSGSQTFEIDLGDGRPEGGGNSASYLVWSQGNTLTNIPGAYNSSPSVRDGQWHMVTATYTNGSQKIYVDGCVSGSDKKTYTLPLVPESVVIGGTDGFGPYHHPWIGDLDEVSIYTSVISPDQVNALYKLYRPNGCATTAPGINPNGLIGWWKGNGNATDSSNSQNNGIFSGQYATGRLGTDKAFNLATGKVNITDIPAYTYQNYPGWSVGFWFNNNGIPLDASNGAFLGQDNEAGEYPKWFIDYGYAHPNAFEVHLNNWNSTPRVFLPSNNTSIPNGWNQFTLVKDSIGFTFYLNGKPIGSATYSGIIPDPTANLVFGYQEPCCYYNGLMQDIVIYNRPLSANEVATLAASSGNWELLVSEFENAYLLGTVWSFDGITGVLNGPFTTERSINGQIQTLTQAPDGNIYVAEFMSGVGRFNGITGAFINQFVSAGSGGLNGADQVVFKDGLLYVSSRFGGQILRYNATTGAFVDIFVSDWRLGGFIRFTFGPDGNIYAGAFNDFGIGQEIYRYSGTTGQYIDTFSKNHPRMSTVAYAGLAFGSDGNLYAARYHAALIERYNGTTGEYMGVFSNLSSTPIANTQHHVDALAFGPDGNLYVSTEKIDAINLWEDNVVKVDAATGNLLGIFAQPPHTNNNVAGFLFRQKVGNGSTVPALITAQVTTSGLIYSRSTKQYSTSVSVKNTGSTAVAGPVSVVFANLPSGVTLVNSSGTYQGSPYVTIPALNTAANTLAVNQTVAFPVQFNAAPPLTVNFIPSVYSGSLNP